jgi:hypothetical protein
MAIQARRALVLSVLALAWGCQKIVEELPTETVVVAPTQVPVVVVPVPVPTLPPSGPETGPNPSPPPPGPQPPGPPPPAPAPTPEPPQSPSGQGCRLPPGNGRGQCPRESPQFLGDMEAALDALIRQEPGIFDLNRTQGCSNCYYVRNVERYISRLPEMLIQRGFCARWDGEEIAVKNTNSFSEQYDILTSSGFIRRQGGSYRATCRPAWF